MRTPKEQKFIPLNEFGDYVKKNHENQIPKELTTRKRSPLLWLVVALLLTASLCALYSFHNCSHHKLSQPENTASHYWTFPSIFYNPQNDNSVAVKPKIKAVNQTLIEQLKNLVFLNYGVTTYKDEFVWDYMPCSYLESQNVTQPYKGWADVGHCNYLYWRDNGEMVDPPSGIRSSVPLGGISTGVFELRGDGKFHEWTIFNQHPAGAAKIQVIDDMFMAISTQESSEDSEPLSLVLQTRPHNNQLTGVSAIEYRGAYPVSKLTVEDPRLPLDVSVYAYSRYKFNDMNSSATPAVALTAVFDNSGPDAVERTASFMINLPVGMEFNSQRIDPQFPKFVPILKSYPPEATYGDIKDTLPHGPVKTSKVFGDSKHEMEMNCFNECVNIPTCKSWSLDLDDGTCSTYDMHVRLNGYKLRSTSGVKSYWTQDSECITVDRDTPEHNTNGNMSLCAFSSDKDMKLSFATGNDIPSLWEDFSSTGQFSAASEGAFVSGAVSGQVTLKPNESKEVTIVLGWYFPDRDFLGIPVGNYYTHLVDNSTDAARKLASNVQDTISDISKLHSTFYGSDVPETLQDMLINSLSHIRSAFWLKDGRWRQWEAHDCTNIDSVHNDGERHIPYIMVFPDSVMNKMRAWASFQLPNGMIQEQLRCGCFDIPIFPKTVEFGCGREMSDVSSMFIVYLLELLQWHPDPKTNDFVKELYPYAKNAAQWHMDRGAKFGIPTYLWTTYDYTRMISYPYVSYTAAFHMLAMKAAERLAVWMNDTEFAVKCEEAFLLGREATDNILWNSTGKYYNAYSTTEEEFDKEAFFTDLNINLCSYPEYHNEEWGECVEGMPTTPGAIMTDTFYAQVLAFSLGLGVLVKDENRLRQHMKAELAHSNTPKGMVVVSGRFPSNGPIPDSDNAIWMMGNANWASINIHLGEDVGKAIEVMREPFEHWRTTLNDIWNVAGILSAGSYTEPEAYVPHLTSHYGYYMSSWHMILALSGQNVDVNEKKILFSPKIEPTFKLPFMLPTIWGQLHSQIAINITTNQEFIINSLSIEFGEMEFITLAVDDCFFPNDKKAVIELSSSQPATWTCPMKFKP